MGELNNLTLSVVFTILGGLVAGLVGYVATMVSLREQRKQRHLEEHKENLRSVSKAIDQIVGEVWIFVFGTGELKLPRPTFGNERRVKHIQIKNEPIQFEVGSQFSENGHVIQVGIDTILYDDITKHFPLLSKLLAKTETEVRKNGIKIIQLLNSLSEKIYEKLGTSNIEFPSWIKTVPESKIKFSELNNESIESNYAGSLFLMVIGEDEENWPSKLRNLRYYGLYDEFKRCSNEIRGDFSSESTNLIDLYRQLNSIVETTKKEIDEIEHTTKLKGKCKYV